MEITNPGPSVNYEPTSFGGPVEDPRFAWSKEAVTGTTGRFKYEYKVDDFAQPHQHLASVAQGTIARLSFLR